MAAKCKVAYSLEYSWMRDEDAKVYVAHIPLLRLTTQAKNEHDIKKAVHQLVTSFVQVCDERGILEMAMRDRGLLRIPDSQVEGLIKNKGQYISVNGNVERDAYSDVPIALLAGKRETAACQR